MTLINDQVQRLDAQLDALQADVWQSAKAEEAEVATKAPSQQQRISEVTTRLRRDIQTLSSSSSSQTPLGRWRIDRILEDLASGARGVEDVATADAGTAQRRELEWTVVAKAALQVHGLVLRSLIDQTLSLSQGSWYWNQIRGSYRYAALYTVQTAPLRLKDWATDVYQDVRARIEQSRGKEDTTEGAERTGEVQVASIESTSLTTRWQQFYTLVRESIAGQNIRNMQRQVLSPLALCRAQARANQKALRSLREKNASAVGILIDETFTFDLYESNGNGNGGSKDRNGSAVMQQTEWKDIVVKSVALLESVLQNLATESSSASGLDAAVFASVESDPDLATQQQERRPAMLASKLQRILETYLSAQSKQFDGSVSKYGVPPWIIRYWLPVALLLVSSSTLLRILTRRQAAVVAWIRDIGQTAIDFWLNWIVQPAKKIIHTIRHDEGSEVALMSKHSLQGDRDSLERMVVDFATDNPQYAGSDVRQLDQATIDTIRAGIKEGDLTPVLRAYEKDIKKPFSGIVTGNLARALLIQVQKTKVDVEVAISGIDSILKSQELVFGFVGLTPSIIILFGLSRWLTSTFGSRNAARRGGQQGDLLRVLRLIDGILTSAKPSASGMLSYKEHGLLLCEVHELRTLASKVMPGPIFRELLEELEELVELRTGVERQRMVVERIRWGFARYIG